MEQQGPPPGYVPFDEELPYKDACPKGCKGGSGGIDWQDGTEHHEDTRCWVCGHIWKQGESPNRR